MIAETHRKILDEREKETERAVRERQKTEFEKMFEKAFGRT